MTLPRRRLGRTDIDIAPCWPRHSGTLERRLGLQSGSTGRSAVHPGDPSRCRSRDKLDRCRAHIRLGPLRLAAFARDDWRRRSEDFEGPVLARNVALRDGLSITGAIVGSGSPDKVDTWIDGASLRLTADDTERIASVIERTGAGAGPLRPALPSLQG